MVLPDACAQLSVVYLCASVSDSRLTEFTEYLPGNALRFVVINRNGNKRHVCHYPLQDSLFYFKRWIIDSLLWFHRHLKHRWEDRELINP